MTYPALSKVLLLSLIPVFMYLPTRQSNPLMSGPVVVSKAFQVLSDANLRAAFDSHGGDPESRSSGVPSFRSANGGGGMRFDNEVSPEELFNMFFGGGFPGGGMQFGGPLGGANGTFFFLARLLRPSPSCPISALVPNPVTLTASCVQ